MFAQLKDASAYALVHKSQDAAPSAECDSTPSTRGVAIGGVVALRVSRTPSTPQSMAAHPHNE